jgi:hypothetical protein
MSNIKKDIVTKAINHLDENHDFFCGRSMLHFKVWMVGRVFRCHGTRNTSQVKILFHQIDLQFIGLPSNMTYAAPQITGMAMSTAAYDIFCIFLLVRNRSKKVKIKSIETLVTISLQTDLVSVLIVNRLSS